jgi:hypothetical protein
MNTVKAAFQALKKQQLPGKLSSSHLPPIWFRLLTELGITTEDIARARGLKLVDVRKVYYGGLV